MAKVCVDCIRYSSYIGFGSLWQTNFSSKIEMFALALET